MAKNNSPNEPNVMGRLEKVVTVGQMLKTIAGIFIGIGTSAIVVYSHFAKTHELKALQCSVLDQNTMNNEMTRATGEIRIALAVLKNNLERPSTAKASSRIAEELSKTIQNVDDALKKVAEVRKKLEEDSIKGERKC